MRVETPAVNPNILMESPRFLPAAQCITMLDECIYIASFNSMISPRNYRLLLIAIASIRNEVAGRLCAGNNTDS